MAAMAPRGEQGAMLVVVMVGGPARGEWGVVVVVAVGYLTVERIVSL